ncbi:hypothetical protein MBLNU13_g09624t1 [Cladosporium sp. NU13]
MAPQRAGQKRKVVEVPRPVQPEEEDALGNGIFDGAIDDGSSSDEGASEGDSEEEEFDEDEDDEEDEELDSDEIPSSDDDTEDVRQQIRDLKTKDSKKLTGSETARDIASISAGTPVKPLVDDDDKPNYVVEKDANGNERYVYKEIEPNYDSDDSDAQEQTNTIGNIPLSYYDAYPHIGYDINGKRIARPAKGEALDSLLESIDLPEGWTGLTDPETGKPMNLSREELEVLKTLTRNEQPSDGYDPYPDMVEWFTGKHNTEIMPLSAAPEPKRRFVPSMHEHKRVMKMVKAIKEGRIKPYREPTEEDKEKDEQEDFATYDVWADEAPRPDHIMNVPAPKLPPPGYEESYHPPAEYLPDKKEREAWENADDEDRTREYLPTDHSALRKVPGYARFVKEKFERCLDLYLAPRVRRSKLNIDPESLLPKLPDPAELRPFPDHVATIFKGHNGRVRTVAIDPSGKYVASGGDDGTVRIWELKTGYCFQRVKLSNEDAVNVVSWRPVADPPILAACCNDSVHFIVPSASVTTPEAENQAIEIIATAFNNPNANPQLKTASGADKASPSTWHRPIPAHGSQGVYLTIQLRAMPKTFVWHRRGDYFATVCPNTNATSTAVAIHTLSKHLSQHPFRRLRGIAQSATFHPSKPLFFVATRQRVRVYDLQQQKLERELQPGARWISSISLHPLGNNLIVSSYDRRLLWHDMDLGNTPYKVLRYHDKAIRNAKFHPSLPLFADASDDGSVQVFHGKVVGDSMENATIVPLKVLRGHKVVKELGVLDLDWHPREAWCVSAGADGTLRLWT